MDRTTYTYHITGSAREVAFQTAMHAHLGGLSSLASGESYGSGFLSGAFGSLAATGAGALIKKCELPRPVSGHDRCRSDIWRRRVCNQRWQFLRWFPEWGDQLGAELNSRPPGK